MHLDKLLMLLRLEHITADELFSKNLSATISFIYNLCTRTKLLLLFFKKYLYIKREYNNYIRSSRDKLASKFHI